MAQISSGNHANLILKPGDVYRVTTSGSATVQGIYGAPAGTTNVNAQSADFGPYGVNAKLRVTAVTGSCDYVIRESVDVEVGGDGRLTRTEAQDAVRHASGGAGARTDVLNGASAGTSSAWLPIAAYPERLAYALDSGSTATTFSVDIFDANQVSLGQAFTGTWASTTAHITQPVSFSNPQARFFRFNVLSGGPLSVSRGY